jgi:hypothetical protein
MLAQLFEKVGFRHASHPEFGRSCGRRRLAGAAANREFSGFGKLEPVPIEPRRQRVADVLASVQDISLASVLAVAIKPWGNFGLVKLPRQ